MNDNAGSGIRGLRASPSPKLFKILRDCYGIDVEENAIDLGGSSSLNLLVYNAINKYVIRIYRPYVTQARLEDIQRIRHQLTNGGIPCSEVIATLDGQTWTMFDGRLMEVEYYVVHNSKMDSWERLLIGLPILGRIHTILHNIKVCDDTRKPMFANHIEPQDVINKTNDGIKRIRAWDNKSPSEIQLADSAEELAHLLSRIERGIVEALPRQLVHRDFWDTNVLFQNDQIVLITDFDFMGERARIDDIALTLYFTCLEYYKEHSSEDYIERLCELVDAYNTGLDYPLTRAERIALPLAIARQTLWSIGVWVALLDDEKLARQHANEVVWDIEWAIKIIHDLDNWRSAFV